MPYGAINTVEINGCVVNGSEIPQVHNCDVFVAVNQEAWSVIDTQAINMLPINGIVAYGVIRAVQVYIAAVDSPVVVVEASAIVPEFRYLAVVKNAVVAVSSAKIFVTKGQGDLFITVIDGAVTHRFAFGGQKA